MELEIQLVGVCALELLVNQRTQHFPVFFQKPLLALFHRLFVVVGSLVEQLSGNAIVFERQFGESSLICSGLILTPLNVFRP